MESITMLFSCPGAFVVTLLYGLVLRTAVTSWPQISVWLRDGSVVVLSALAIELLLLWGLGIADARRLLDPTFSDVHCILFFLSTPSFANLLLLQKRAPFLAYPFVAAIPCAILAFFLTILHYCVTEPF